MNILKRELKAGLKPFIFWMIGILVLVYAGTMKYEGFSTGGVDMTELLSQFPRAFLAVLGMANVDINTLSGYMSILFFYTLICVVIYAVHLGSSAVTRESVDKTYEFVFTKPRTRTHVLAMKLAAAWIYLLLFCIFTVVFAVMATASLNTTEQILDVIVLFALSNFLVGSLFIALSSFLAAASNRPDKGSLWGNLAFTYAFILGIVYDMLENGGILRVISPMRYFPAAELVDGKFSLVYTALTLVLTVVFLFGAQRLFQKKDLV